MRHHHEPEGHGKRFVCCFEGQGHSKGWYDQSMTVSTVSSELLILLLPNSVWKYIIISQNVLWRNWIVIFKVKVTTKVPECQWMFAHMICSELLNPDFTTKLCVLMHHHEPDCLPEKFVCCLQGQGHSEGSYNQDDCLFYLKAHIVKYNVFLPYLLNCWSFATKFNWMVHHRKLECFV